jgi:hypothetical protein
MAIVPNLDGQGIKANGAVGVVDPSYTIPTVYAAGVPTLAGYPSELRADSATGDIYRCLSGTRWVDAQ